MTEVAQATNLGGNVLQFPLKKPPRKEIGSHWVPRGLQCTCVYDDLIARNDRLAEVLESLAELCESSLQNLPAGDYDRIINHLSAALENSARIRMLLDERNDRF